MDLANTAKQALEQIITDAVSVREFVIEQTPDVVQQLLAWAFWSSLIEAVAPIVILIAIVIATITTLKKLPRATKAEMIGNSYDYTCGIHDMYFIPTVAIGGFSTVISLVAVGCTFNITWLQILVAPKVWLLEYASQLVK